MLTAVSVILLPLTLVASVFVMNVHVPGKGSPVAFWAILITMVAILGGMVLFSVAAAGSEGLTAGESARRMPPPRSAGETGGECRKGSRQVTL